MQSKSFRASASIVGEKESERVMCCVFIYSWRIIMWLLQGETETATTDRSAYFNQIDKCNNNNCFTLRYKSVTSRTTQ